MLENMYATPKVFGVELSDLYQLRAYFARIFGMDLKQTSLEVGVT